MGHVIVWADIPVTDLDRAIKFYAHVTGEYVAAMPGQEGIALIGGPDPSQPQQQSQEMVVSADLYVGGKPSMDGPTIYLSSKGDIDGMLERVVEAGGTILDPKANRGEMIGWIAFIKDTEGNRIGIQQPLDSMM